ncbi:Type VI secretion protein ImpG [Enterobacterales bacterium 8AC]|nr:Type VI secretion protein ImpG [Enterobacterales bacterium 8AC]
MEDLTLRYFEAEMRYLKEAAREFADAHPDRAAQLSLDRVGDIDPYVERLFEGFAFSMGRLREKLDDDLPEFTEGLVSLLWPHYLRTIPSLSVVELAPDVSQMKMQEKVPLGFEVLSQPVGPKNTVCRYRTTQEMRLNPIALETAQMATEPDGRSVLRLRFRVSELVDVGQMDLSRLSLYLNADAPVSAALHLALTKQQAALYLRVPGAADRQPLKGYFSPGGFADEDRLWPKGDSAFSGYQLLLEYFTFREKFMFVHLHGLENMVLPPRASWFELEVVLGTLWNHELPVSANNLRLHCVPVINLFTIEADPLIISGLESEYLLRPRRLQDGYTEIYSVDGVSGSQRLEETQYVPFTSFRHRGGMLRHTAPERYYHTRVKRGPSGLHDTWLILGGHSWEEDRLFERETVSLQITGTNGQLPRKALRSTLINRCEQSLQIPLRVQNLCPPTLPCYPPAEDRFHWRVMSHLGSNFLSMMASAEVLRGTLALYDWLDNEMTRRKLEAIVDVKQHLIQRFEQGFLLRGTDIEVTLNSDGFSGEGDINLFGEMLNRFFALYADIHLFNQLTLILQPSGKCLRWNENHSQRIPG